MTIKILNPLHGAATHVGLKRAQRYIKAGKAEMVGPLLRFIEEHHAHRSVVENFEIRHTQGGYDRVRRRMTDREMKAIPIINPHEMLAPVGRLVQKPKRMRAMDVNGRPFKSLGEFGQ